MHSRVLKFSFAFLVAVAVVVVAPPDTAEAQTRVPPFEIVFPQETGPTEFRSSFGEPRSGGRRHNGTDLLAPKMTEVYAIADGVVTYVGTNNLSGRNLRIEHGDGWESIYVHLNNDNIGTDDGRAPWNLTVAPGIEEGVDVGAGQHIAWVGDSGNAEWTTPHTHFELRIDGRPIDGYDLLVEAYERAAQARFEEMIAEFDYEID
ncbi:MAG TPA: M23 family metallopeptidase [Acidimicrobiia bacterium]|nr:M23 family metallopeptidase [Acidimicrobiia bacterium]